jgi:hypothetical protein
MGKIKILTDSLIFLGFFPLYQREPALCHFWMNVHACNCQGFFYGCFISEPTNVISVRFLFYVILYTCGIVHFIARVMEFRLKCPE